jgi:hypothetical protein
MDLDEAYIFSRNTEAMGEQISFTQLLNRVATEAVGNKTRCTSFYLVEYDLLDNFFGEAPCEIGKVEMVSDRI